MFDISCKLPPLHEMSNPVFWENKKKISKCRLQKNLSRVLSIKESNSLSEKDDFAFHSDIPDVLEKGFIITS